MSKIHSKYTNFILYGSQSTSSAIDCYKDILKRISKFGVHNLTVGFLTPENFQSNIQNFNNNCLIWPLFLTNGFEYKKFTEQLLPQLTKTSKIASPLSKYQEILELIFQTDDDTCYLMHGSTKYNNFEQYSDILNFAKEEKKFEFCFLEGNPHFQTIFNTYIKSKKYLNISPLFIFTGNHLKNDVATYLSTHYEPNQWQIQPALLEREEIREVISQISINELSKR